MPLRIPKSRQGQLTRSHARAPKQEREVAAALGGKVTPGSGAFDMKGDVQVRSVARIECKTTANKSFSVTREMVAKIEDAALGAGEVPAIVVEFLSPKGRPESSVAVVPVWVLGLVADLAKTNKP